MIVDTVISSSANRMSRSPAVAKCRGQRMRMLDVAGIVNVRTCDCRGVIAVYYRP